MKRDLVSLGSSLGLGTTVMLMFVGVVPPLWLIVLLLGAVAAAD